MRRLSQRHATVEQRTVNATAVLLRHVTRHLYCHCVAWHAQSLVHANGCVAAAYETVSSSLNFAVGLIYIRTGSNAVHVQLLRAMG